ncbi:MAG: sugar phosphate nucleotidyltransferase [Coriobacteriia bacterium]|nr:sugar phosphate nucleotidyltransferase [Coriobacteriia bacterium]
MDKVKDTTLVILAAGMGSRYGGLKQLDEVGPSGEAILDYSVYDAIQAGFTKVVFIIRHDFESLFKEKVVSKYKDAIKVELVFQDLTDLPEGYSLPEGREKPWGTAHALLTTKDVVHEPFAVINADDFYSRDAFVKANEFLTSGNIGSGTGEQAIQFAMVGFQLSNTLSDNGSVARGVCTTDENDNLVSVEELLKIFKTPDGAEDRPEGEAPRSLTGNEPVSMNMWCFTPEVFQYFGDNFNAWLDKNLEVPKSEFLIPTEVDKLIKDGIAEVKLLHTDAKWFGVTYKEDKPIVVDSIQKLVDGGLYPEKLF